MTDMESKRMHNKQFLIKVVSVIREYATANELDAEQLEYSVGKDLMEISKLGNYNQKCGMDAVPKYDREGWDF